jgi:hypothetical protein
MDVHSSTDTISLAINLEYSTYNWGTTTVSKGPELLAVVDSLNNVDAWFRIIERYFFTILDLPRT